ncbi:uncharacterized protein [Rutidosis leptorrhynchoides]|uniref:uncharacterized protein n=1 Tax=Rutidosis leptorrhynchoides TaxID=125765 RepID=UPI003A99FED1
MAREWFTSLPPRSITSFLDLRENFVMQYQSLRSYIPESQLVSGFIFCLDQRCFARMVQVLCYDVPKTLHHALVIAQKHLRAGEMGYSRVDNYQRNFRQQEASTQLEGNNHPNDNNHQRKPLDRHPLIIASTKTPKEILFTEWVKETFHPPPLMKERQGPQSDKWCDFHETYGHDTDNCKSLMREIIAKIKAGELNHLLPGKKYRRNDPNKRFVWQGKVHHGGRRD